MNKEGACARPIHNQRPKTARLSLAATRNPLLDDAAAKIGGNQSSFRVLHRPAQCKIGDAGLVCKALNALVLNIRTHLHPIATLPNETV